MMTEVHRKIFALPQVEFADEQLFAPEFLLNLARLLPVKIQRLKQTKKDLKLQHQDWCARQTRSVDGFRCSGTQIHPSSQIRQPE